jgi:CubicO group peptidase (beta-lactamase class C family)
MSKRIDLARRVDDLLRKRAEEETFSGVVRITVGADEVFAGAYGLASRPWQVPNQMETRFDTASLTKLFTTVAALQLVDEGAFDLDARVMPYLELNGTAISNNVSLFQLLTHSSGIGDETEEEAGEEYADLWKEKPSYSVT